MNYTEAGAYTNEATIADGADIDAAGVILTNTESGRIVTGVRFNAGGSTVINELGGIVRVADGADPYSTAAVTGSSGDDTFVNYGLVAGLIQLGEGSDRYTKGGTAGTADWVDLGAGDDVLVRVGNSGWLIANGGSGTDAVEFEQTNNTLVYGSDLTGFETLKLTGEGQYSGFSGYTAITLGAPAGYGQSLSYSDNPLVDLALVGNSMRLALSSLHSIVGSAANETVELSSGAWIAAHVDLGGGDDTLVLSRFGPEPGPALPGGGADGGDGTDTLALLAYNETSMVYDIASLLGFEHLNVNNSNVSAVDLDLTNADGFATISLGSLADLILRSSQSPDAVLDGGLGGSIMLDAGTAIARYTAIRDYGPFGMPYTEYVQGDDRQSVHITNLGQIAGGIAFNIGDDRYDGSAGSVGGTVLGNAGNDTMIGGVGAERFEGGYGADRLYGGGGNDTLLGGAGNDILDGGAGEDSMAGGAGNDIYFVDSAGDQVVEDAAAGYDTVFTQVSYTLGANVERVVAFDAASTAGLSFTGNALNNEISGNAGANLIDGGAGADFMSGQGGDDIYFVDNAGDYVLETAAGGFDTVFAGVSYTLTPHVERVFALDPNSTAALNFTGNDLANELGGTAGANILDGGLGADLMVGGDGDDIYFVDNIGDVVSDSPTGGYDTVFASISFVLETRIERVVALDPAATTALSLTGNASANEISGNAGGNLIDGGGGADVLLGLGGADAFAFSALGGGNLAQLPDFEVGIDRFYLDDAAFAGLAPGVLAAGAFHIGSAAADADDRIIYDSATGALYFDADGSGAGLAVQFANLHEGLPLNATDFQVI